MSPIFEILNPQGDPIATAHTATETMKKFLAGHKIGLLQTIFEIRGAAISLAELQHRISDEHVNSLTSKSQF